MYKTCGRKFDDLTGTIFSGSYYSLTTWITVLYLMHLHLNNSQIAGELEIAESSVFELFSRIREGIVKKTRYITMVSREGQLILRVVENVQQKTFYPHIKQYVKTNTSLYR